MCRFISSTLPVLAASKMSTVASGPLEQNENNANTTKIEVYAEDDTKAAAKVLKAIPTAQNIVVSSAPS